MLKLPRMSSVHAHLDQGYIVEQGTRDLRWFSEIFESWFTRPANEIALSRTRLSIPVGIRVLYFVVRLTLPT